MFISFAVAAPLALLRRSLVASAGIDARIGELLAVEKSLLNNGGDGIAPPDFDNHLMKSGGLSERESSGIFPRGLEWKTQTLGRLTRDLVARSLFVDRALRSLEEGLLIAEPGGRITFANRRAAEILGLSEPRLIGSDLFARIGEAQNEARGAASFAKEPIVQSLIDRISVKREIVIGDSAQCHYALHFSTVVSEDGNAGETLGIVATLSDITHHRELEQIKSDVVTLVTHELRTPLTAIQGMSEVLAEHDVEPESRGKMLATINNEAKRLARMINEYLDLTRLESGMQKAHFTNINITDLLEQTLLLLEPLAARREIKIMRLFEPNLPLVFADAGMLAQALTNIVGNAVKYSPQKTTITIETRMDECEVLKISVADEGYGISEEQLPHIFEKFYRVPHRRTADVSGTGLGLALTRQIIELHGGRIEVESKLNAGSTFTIFLPLFSEFRNE